MQSLPSTQFFADFSPPRPLPPSRKPAPGKALVLVNSGRLDEIGRTGAVVRSAHRLVEGPELGGLATYDVAIKESSVRGSEFRDATLRFVARHPVRFAAALIRHRSLGAALIEMYRHWLRREGVVSLDLFSSNSRLIEAARLAAVIDGLTVVEYLHGVSTDNFARYYDLLAVLAGKSQAQLHYVNMLPGLPQPSAVEQRLLRHGGNEVYFQNERRWKPRGPRMFDVLIVGSGGQNFDYVQSSFFRSELETARACVAAGLKVVHCPHPFEFDQVKPLMPEGVELGRLADYANSARVLVGHFSTALFTARLRGHEVLLFPAAWRDVPSNQAALFDNREVATLSFENLQSRIALVKERGDATPTMAVSGLALDRDPEGTSKR